MSQLDSKVAIVTGGNSGIGKETVVALADMGGRVVIAARNPQKAAAAVKEVQERTRCADRVDTMPIDLASFASVRAFADAFNARYDRCDILVNNAGGVLSKRVLTEDGHESQFQVNHLSHFLLTNLLRDRLAQSAPTRVVVVASMAHRTARKGVHFDDLDWERRRYRGFMAYSETKLMNILFARELAKRWDGTGVSANSVHPGFVGSNFAREGDLGWWGNIGMPLVRPFAISNEKGARTSVYVATSPEVDGINGQYFSKCRVTVPAAPALDDAAAQQLWDVSAQLTGVGSPSAS
jgi:NAD(P)-dependent dehydrogenase (short-subunit alcohol dehydrogenase family)